MGSSGRSAQIPSPASIATRILAPAVVKLAQIKARPSRTRVLTHLRAQSAKLRCLRQLGPSFCALLPCLLALLLPGRAGWNGAVEDTTTAIAAALGPVGPRPKQLRARLGVTLTRTLAGCRPGRSTSRRVTANLRPSRTKGTSGCSPSSAGCVWFSGDHDLVLGAGEAAEVDNPGAALVRQHRQPAGDPQHVRRGRGRASPGEAFRQEGFPGMRMA